MVSRDLAIKNIGTTLMTSSKKRHEHGWLEAKQSGGAVYELGVKQSRHGKTIRRIAEPLMKKHWKNSVTICTGYTGWQSICLKDRTDQTIKIKAITIRKLR